MRILLLFLCFVLGGCVSTMSSTLDSTTTLPDATDKMAHGRLDGDSTSQNVSSDHPAWSVVFVAHRGGVVDGIPENTLAAFL